MGATLTESVIMPRPLKWHHRLAAWLLHWIVRLVALTLRPVWNDHSGCFNGERRPVIFAIWHNRLAICMMIYHDYIRKRDRHAPLAAIVSASHDGGVLARVLQKFEVQPVRGSSSRRGPQALLELTSWAERGYHLAITPDGPRGPRYRAQEGVIGLAQITGHPIIPISSHLKWKIRLKSWDGFQVPLPFASVDIEIGQPIYVPRNASDAERESLRLQVEKQLEGLTRD